MGDKGEGHPKLAALTVLLTLSLTWIYAWFLDGAEFDAGLVIFLLLMAYFGFETFRSLSN